MCKVTCWPPSGLKSKYKLVLGSSSEGLAERKKTCWDSMIPRPNDTTAEAQFPSLFSSQLINANIQSKACDWTHTVNPTFKDPYTY